MPRSFGGIRRPGLRGTAGPVRIGAAPYRQLWNPQQQQTASWVRPQPSNQLPLPPGQSPPARPSTQYQGAPPGAASQQQPDSFAAAQQRALQENPQFAKWYQERQALGTPINNMSYVNYLMKQQAPSQYQNPVDYVNAMVSAQQQGGRQFNPAEEQAFRAAQARAFEAYRQQQQAKVAAAQQQQAPQQQPSPIPGGYPTQLVQPQYVYPYAG